LRTQIIKTMNENIKLIDFLVELNKLVKPLIGNKIETSKIDNQIKGIVSPFLYEYGLEYFSCGIQPLFKHSYFERFNYNILYPNKFFELKIETIPDKRCKHNQKGIISKLEFVCGYQFNIVYLKHYYLGIRIEQIKHEIEMRKISIETHEIGIKNEKETIKELEEELRKL